jgi:YVTN family beta-propeller protein
MRRLWFSAAITATMIWHSGCGGSKQTVAITISPTTATVRLAQTQQFTATVTGNSDTNVTWTVNGVNGGNTSVGTVSTLGLYTAPVNALNPSSVSVTATSVADTSKTASATVTIDSGATVTVSPSSITINAGDQFQFTDTVSNVVGNSTASTAVDWKVSDVQGGNSTTGTISQTGLYFAPQTIGSQQTFVVKAVLQSDSSSFGTANVTVVPANAPTLSTINPRTVSQGSLLEDIYLTGSNFVGTDQVRANGIPVATSFISTGVLRARIPGTFLTSTGTVFIDIQSQQNLALSSIARLTVSQAPPTLISSSPDSTILNGSGVNFTFDGGYYNPATTAEFNDVSHSLTVENSRKILVPLTSQDLTAAGLFSVKVRNPLLPQEIAAANIAVEPTPAPPAIPAVLSVGQNPMSVALNTATGVALVANHDSNSLTVVQLTGNPTAPAQLGATVAVGTAPTSVAIDNLRNLAVVTNNGSNNVSIVDLSVSPPVVKATLTTAVSGSGTFLGLLPYAAGVNPLSGKALVVYQNSTQATIIDLDKLAVSATSQITLTGSNPQVAVDPRLNWGIVTPGGNGGVSFVDLNGGGQEVVSLIAVPSSNGAKRSSNTVTVTTTAAHGLTVNEQVTIAGVDDASFDGTFTVASVPSGASFTYTQTGSDATSGNGTVSAAAPLVTVSVNQNMRGVSINPQTEMAILTDPTSTSVSLMSLLNQTVSNTITLESGTTASAVNPLTNIAVTVNSVGNQASVIDLQQPQRLEQVTVGSKPTAVAIDPVNNVALVVNQGSNTVSVLQMAALRPLQITQMNPFSTLTSTSSETLTIVGSGFVSGSVARLSETLLQTTYASPRMLRATIPSSLLAAPRRYIVDVRNPDGTVSNVEDFTVMQAIPVGQSPRAVAIDAERDMAVVTNSGDKTVSLIDLKSLSIMATLTVGTTPTGVAVSSRAGIAAVTNTDSDTVSIISLDQRAVGATVNVAPSSGTSKPMGVAIHPGTGLAVVADSNAKQISFFSATNPGTATTLALDVGPSAVAIDPTRNIAAVAEAGSNTVVIVSLDTKQVLDRVTGFQLPTGGIYDPDSDAFLITSSLNNNFGTITASTTNPASATYSVTFTAVGINPTSLDYNYRSGTLVTANTTSSTISVMDFLTKTVKAILPVAASQQFGIAVHPRTNQAVIVDQNNHRVLIVPLPR